MTLFELGREVTSVLDLDELLEKIPQLIARMTKFTAFAVYLLDEAKAENIVTIDLAGKSSIGDYMVIATGRSDRHVGAIAVDRRAP